VWRLQSDRGTAAGFEAIAFGFLIFVLGTLLVANAWDVIDARFAVAAAAREAARAYVEAESADQAFAQGQQAAQATMAAYGRPDPPAEAAVETTGAFARCVRATWTVTYPVSVLVLPGVFGLDEVYTVRASHSEIVDPLRTGLEGEATCVEAL
jgi:Flp pilus assembly protein TadG